MCAHRQPLSPNFTVVMLLFYVQPNYSKIAENCNLWRNYDDISDSWDSVLGIIQHYAAVQDTIQPFAGPGHWNDPDMVS